MKKPILIAEIGINHQGNWDTLEKMVDESLKYADYAKVQIRTPRICVPKSEWDKPKATPWGDTMPYIQYREMMEIPKNVLLRLMEKYKNENGRSRLFASFWDLECLVNYLYDYRLRELSEFIKIPSAKITDADLMKFVFNSRFCGDYTVMVSTGMSTKDEILQVRDWYDESCWETPEQMRENKIVVMSCNSSYPTPDNEVNLLRMTTLQGMFGNRAETGFSSHSSSPYPAIYSAFYGARYVEVHYTLDRTWIGSDHAASLETPALQLISRELSRIPVLHGDGLLSLSESEYPARSKLRGN